MKKEIIIRCSCGSPLYLTFWKNEDFEWELTINNHWLPLWLRIKYAFKLLFKPSLLCDWSDFGIKNEEMIRLAKKVLEK